MLKKIILAIIASLLTTATMMYVYKTQFRKVSDTAIQDDSTESPLDVSTVEHLPNFQAALHSIKTVNPRTIKELPKELLHYLEREKCQIPQATNDPNKQGWIRGHFYKKTQIDFAILCLTPQKEMTIKIHWGGDEHPCPISIGYGQAKNWVIPRREDQFSYMRSLLKAGHARLKYFVYYAKLTPPNEDQEALEDTLLNTNSIIWYCLDGRWQKVRTH